MGDRNSEIWSTRLQREILALETSDDESKKIELLPPFIKTIGHTLKIEGGIAKIEFWIDVEASEEAQTQKKAHSDPGEGAIDKDEDSSGGCCKDAGKVANEGDDSQEEEKRVKDDNEEKVDGANVGESIKDSRCLEGTGFGPKDATKSETGSHVVLVLDASLYWKSDMSPAQSKSPQCYPFLKPLAIIKSGAHLFSGGSTISNGDEIDVDLDWTPSIHLSDAVTNVALKVRECVKRGEPLHPAKREDYSDDGLSGSIIREAREARESLLETKKAMGAMFSSGISSLSARGSSIAAKSQSASKSVSKSFMSLGESLAKLGEDMVDEVSKEEAFKEPRKEVKHIPDIGDEIDLSEEPWNQCTGMYSCKAIRRPAFVDAAMAKAAKNQNREKETSSAGSMFSRFAQSAKSVMEESFLMITEKCIIEFKSNRLNIGSGTVSFAIKIDQMAKLKFRREESLSLFFKQASDDPLVYMCLDSALAVQDIQNVLKRHGVKGKHTNASTQRAVQMALNLVALIQHKEKELIDNPTVDRVNEIMDLYRQAAEKFETAGDPRHTEVMAHMKRFLGQQFTTSILDGSFGKTVKKNEIRRDEMKSASPVPQGEILEQPTYNLSNDDDDEDDDNLVSEDADMRESPIKEHIYEGKDSTLQSMEDILNEAVKDMSDLGMGDEHINNILTSPSKESSSTPTDDPTDDLKKHDDTFAELDAMLSNADKELNELLNS